MEVVLVSEFGGFDSLILDVAWSPTGEQLAVVDLSFDVIVVSGESGERKVTIKNDEDLDGGCHHIAFSPDGSLLVHDQNACLVVCDIATGTQIRQVKGFCGDDISLCYSENGDLFAASDYGIKLFEPTSFRRQSVIKRKDIRTTAFCFSPNSNCIACAYDDGQLAVWQLDPRQQEAIWKAHELPIACVSFAGAHQLVTCADGEPVKIWDVQSGQLIVSLDVGYSQYRRIESSKRNAAVTIEGLSLRTGQWSVSVLDYQSHATDYPFGTDAVLGGVFSPAEDRIVTWGNANDEEAKIQIWSIH